MIVKDILVGHPRLAHATMERLKTRDNPTVSEFVEALMDTLESGSGETYVDEALKNDMIAYQYERFLRKLVSL
jgi:hypothetical protein